MPAVVIDIYNSGISVSDGEKILADCVSCALIESSSHIIVGDAAAKQAYLRPREISTNYWNDLSSHSETRYVLSNAEIAYAHLQNVWEQTELQDQDVMISVPNTFTKQDLGLLLGMTEKLSIPVSGIACNAILGQSGPIRDCCVIFLDLQQSCLVVTEIKQNKNDISVGLPKKIFNYGLQILLNNVAEAIAKQFIEDTRFDPLHLVEHEQYFFEVFPSWLAALKSADALDCKFTSDTHSYTIRLNKEHIRRANEILLNQLSAFLSMEYHKKDALTIICSASCADIYGFEEFLIRLPGCAVTILDKNSLAKHAISLQDQIHSKGKQIHYVTSLAWNKTHIPTAVNFSSGNLSELHEIPTHALINNQAYLINEDLYLVKSSQDNKLTLKTIVSDRAICKIAKNSFLITIEPLDASKVKLNNKSLDANESIHIGDRLSVEGYLNQVDFIKVDNHET